MLFHRHRDSMDVMGLQGNKGWQENEEIGVCQ